MDDATQKDDPMVQWRTPSGNATIWMRQSEARRRDRQQRRARIFGRAPGVFVVLALLAASFGISWWVTGGNVRCIFSDDPALCATVSEVGR